MGELINNAVDIAKAGASAASESVKNSGDTVAGYMNAYKKFMSDNFDKMVKDLPPGVFEKKLSELTDADKEALKERVASAAKLTAGVFSGLSAAIMSPAVALGGAVVIGAKAEYDGAAASIGEVGKKLANKSKDALVDIPGKCYSETPPPYKPGA